jgi:hypothetical protein
VIAAVGCNTPMSIFDSDVMKFKQCIFHHLERNQIDQVMINGAMLELKTVISERREDLGVEFLSANIDVWRDSHHKEDFGVLVIDLIAQQYYGEDLGMLLFISKETVAHLGDSL